MNVYQKMTLYLQPKSNSYCHRTDWHTFSYCLKQRIENLKK